MRQNTIYLQKTSTDKRCYITLKKGQEMVVQTTIKVPFSFSKYKQSYLSLKERLIDLLNSHDGHFDDKQPLKGDCRNSEDLDSCF